MTHARRSLLGGQRGALLMQSSGVGNLHQHAVDDKNLPLPADDAGNDARRV
jgi:hypothetical protein